MMTMVLLPDPRLFEVSVPVSIFDDDLRAIAHEMMGMMHQSRALVWPVCRLAVCNECL